MRMHCRKSMHIHRYMVIYRVVFFIEIVSVLS